MDLGSHIWGQCPPTKPRPLTFLPLPVAPNLFHKDLWKALYIKILCIMLSKAFSIFFSLHETFIFNLQPEIVPVFVSPNLYIYSTVINQSINQSSINQSIRQCVFPLFHLHGLAAGMVPFLLSPSYPPHSMRGSCPT